MKKALSLVLTLVMLMSVFAISSQAFAAEYVADSDARSMLDMINSFRTGSDAWYWNQDNTTKTTLTNLANLQSDEELEKSQKSALKSSAEETEESISHTQDPTVLNTQPAP